jgi:hypothetical protein
MQQCKNALQYYGTNDSVRQGIWKFRGAVEPHYNGPYYNGRRL